MPEGPEIRRAADQISRAIVGEPAEVEFGLPSLTRRGRDLSGRVIESVETRGKAMLIRFEGDRIVYSHNQLYGVWKVVKSGTRPRTGRQLRLRIENDRKAALLYSASEIEVLRSRDLARHPYLEKLGPDVLNEQLDPQAVEDYLHECGFQRRALGGLLLDQGFLAGVGNYLRSEILFRAGILPERRLGDLNDAERRALADAVVSMIRRGYRQRGATTSSGLLSDLKAAGASWRERRHYVFNRAGRPCHDCGQAIEKWEVAGRRLYSCPGCQA